MGENIALDDVIVQRMKVQHIEEVENVDQDVIVRLARQRGSHDWQEDRVM